MDKSKTPKKPRRDGEPVKFVLRVPVSLHPELVEAARREGVSMNSFCVLELTKAVNRIRGGKS